jgi:2-haloacid dehalogenase
MSNPTPDTVVFDLGGVVLRWEPKRAYQQVMPADQVDDFMTEISFDEWNRYRDAGHSWEKGEAELIATLPHRQEAIEAYRRYFDHTIPGMVPGTGAIMAELQRAGIRLVGLTNWSADLFRPTYRRFGLLHRFAGIVVSGEEGIIKPDPQLFEILFDRYQVDPAHTVFIDDSAANCATAERLGMGAIRFADADRTRQQLVDRDLLGERRQPDGPIFHLARRHDWEHAQQSGEYCWSTRRISYEAQGFVHCSFADQVPSVRGQFYADCADDDLVVLRLDPDRLSVPVVVEDLGTGVAYPHLYGELPVAEVSEVGPVPATP